MQKSDLRRGGELDSRRFVDLSDGCWELGDMVGEGGVKKAYEIQGRPDLLCLVPQLSFPLGYFLRIICKQVLVPKNVQISRIKECVLDDVTLSRYSEIIVHRCPGVPVKELSMDFLSNISDEFYEKLFSDFYELYKVGLGCDVTLGENVLFDESTGFWLIDIDNNQIFREGVYIPGFMDSRLMKIREKYFPSEK